MKKLLLISLFGLLLCGCATTHNTNANLEEKNRSLNSNQQERETTNRVDLEDVEF